MKGMYCKPNATTRIVTVDDGGAAMTFVEIAEAMGYRNPRNQGKKAVYMCYVSAMRKLRRYPRALAQLQETARALQAVRAEREAPVTDL